MSKRFVPEPTSAPGDFYVENDCCTQCGVPQIVAPDLVGWVDPGSGHCYWKKQPQTHAEMEQAFKIFDGQEIGCHRYAGSDPDIQRRIGVDNCDHVTPAVGYWSGRASEFTQAFWKRISSKRK